MSTPRTVLISEPGSLDMTSIPYLPYMWGVLKTYWEKHGGMEGAWHWLDPIHQPTHERRLLAPYGDTRIDVLGLSCYTWNWDLQCRIAADVKVRHPECLVVAGGPHPDYKDAHFFDKHPYIDVVAVKDGEITFTQILAQLAGGDLKLTEIPGLYLPDPGGSKHLCTGPAEVPEVFESSPYIAQSGYYDSFIRDVQGVFSAVWETNRGCPYACSFCDWGSATMSRPRRFSMERVQAEIEWLAEHRAQLLFLADANFGLYPRDLEIADMIVDTFRRHQHPRTILYSHAKNKQARTVEISKKLFDIGMTFEHTLSIQHTRKEVLAATDRSNIPSDAQIEVVRELVKHGIPIDVQLILGIPGDTYELWKGCLADLMEWDLHSYYVIFRYHLLPNAPAAEPDFLRKWGVQTVERYVFASAEIRLRRCDVAKDTQALAMMGKGRIIVETSTYSRDDYVRMNVYSAFVKALHGCGLTQLVSRYLRHTHGVPFLTFYSRLIEDFCTRYEPIASWHRVVTQASRRYLEDDEAVEYLPIDELPDYPFVVNPHRWIFAQACLYADRFYAALRAYLFVTYPTIRNLDSLLQYQANVVVTPAYDARVGKRFRTDLDWVSYFAQPLGSAMQEPSAVPGAVVAAEDKQYHDRFASSPMDWCDHGGHERWHAWVNRMVWGQNSAEKNLLQELKLMRSDGRPLGVPQHA